MTKKNLDTEINTKRKKTRRKKLDPGEKAKGGYSYESKHKSVDPKVNPTKKYKYKTQHCEDLIEFMAKGYSFEAFAGHLKVSRETLYNWEAEIPEFAEAKKEAFARCQIFWESAGLGGMYMGGKDNPFNATVWVFNMKNRFNWTDKRESKVEGKVTLESLIDESFEDED